MFNHLRNDEIRNTSSNNQDVSEYGELRKITCLCMANCNSCITLQKHERQGFTNYVAGPNDYHIFPSDFYSFGVKKELNTVWCTWRENCSPNNQSTDVVQMKSIYIFGDGDLLQYLAIVDMLWKWQLDQYPVHRLVVIK